MAAAKTPLELVRPAAIREMVLRSELTKRTDELERVKMQSREAISKIEANYDDKPLQEIMKAMHTLKDCYREARQEIKYLRYLLGDHLDQIYHYKGMYLKVKEDVEEQKMLLEIQDMDNLRISEQINLEILSIRKKFEERLRDLEQYPELLKKTEAMLMKEREKNAKAEHSIELLTSDLNNARERVHILMHTVIQVPEETEEELKLKKKADELHAQKVASLNNYIEKLKLEIERLKSKLLRMEDKSLHDEKRLMEKLHDCAVLGAELDSNRVKASTALANMTKRYEVASRNMEIKINDLEYKLGVTEAKVLSSEQEKERAVQDVENKLMHVNEAYEIAQQRIMILTAKLQELRKTWPVEDEPSTPSFDSDDAEKQAKIFCQNCDGKV